MLFVTILTGHINILHDNNAELLNVKTPGTYSKRRVLKLPLNTAIVIYFSNSQKIRLGQSKATEIVLNN